MRQGYVASFWRACRGDHAYEHSLRLSRGVAIYDVAIYHGWQWVVGDVVEDAAQGQCRQWGVLDLDFLF